jgi:hypothetical protein
VTNNSSSGVRRMISGYTQRDGTKGTDTLATNLSVMPAWYARYRTNHFGGAYSTAAGLARPAVAGTNTLGIYAQDFSYYGDQTNAATGLKYVPGTNTFDLDVWNGRWCVTPEFPSGTYAYFLTIDANGAAVYPYAIAYEYYGSATGGSVNSISETVTTNFTGAANSTLTVNSPATTNSTVTLTWSAVEGGTYSVVNSGNLTTWTTNLTGLAAVLNKGTTTTTKISTNQFFKVIRTALANYDAN